MDSDIEIINNSATKLEETTVTLQSNNPSKPITKNVIPALHSKGIATHLKFLKTIDKEIRNKTKTPNPNVFRSF